MQAALETLLYNQSKVDLVISGHGELLRLLLAAACASTRPHPPPPPPFPLPLPLPLPSLVLLTVHAYERSCRTFNYTCISDGPVYITVGDGGNKEGLATKWVSPQPQYSLFRQASFGHGELTAYNSSTLHWRWKQNRDLFPAFSDEVWIAKGVQGAVGPGTTGPTGRLLR